MKNGIIWRIIIIFLLATITTMIINSTLPLKVIFADFSRQDDLAPLYSYKFSPHEPISIDGNTNFIEQATSEEWSGDGSEVNPYLIDGHSIIGSGGDSVIAIWNTDLFFQISNCDISGGGNGIYLDNVINGFIINNIVHNNEGLGIYIEGSDYVTVSNNIVHDNGPDCGIDVRESSDSVIKNNTVYNTPGHGILVESESHNNIVSENILYGNTASGISILSGNNAVTLNIIHNNGGQGMYILESDNNLITNNVIYENNASGVDLVYCNENIISWNNVSKNNIGIFFETSCNSNTISNNNIYENDGEGGIFFLDQSKNNIISSNFIHNNDISGVAIHSNSNGNSLTTNTISNNGNDGIHLDSANNNNLIANIIAVNDGNGITIFGSLNYNNITSNTLANNSNYGISLGSSSNTITWNNFIGNGIEIIPIIHQALDEGSNNEFSYNYWDDWTSPDTNGDNIVDNPYDIDGGSQDLHPLVSAHEFIPNLSLIYPNGGKTLNDTVTIAWATVNDSYNHNVSYSVYYSSDNGNTWNLLASGLGSTSYFWDTTILTSGDLYLIKIVATCSEGLIAEDTSDETFTIRGVGPKPLIYPPTIEFLLVALVLILLVLVLAFIIQFALVWTVKKIKVKRRKRKIEPDIRKPWRY